MLVISRPGIGKTRALMSLPRSLHIDIGGSSGYYTGTAINIPEIVAKTGKGPIKVLKDVILSIQEKTKLNKDYLYDFIVVDELTRLEYFCEPYATALYKKTSMGKKSGITDIIAEGEYGLGYYYLREAVSEFIMPLLGLSRVCTILVGHVKDSQINKDGKLVTVSDLNMTGKLRAIIPGLMDANATMYVDPENAYQRILSFKSSSGDIITKARPEHLLDKEIVISEMNPETLEYRTNWHKVFLDLPDSV
jgi:hypothetical protein